MLFICVALSILIGVLAGYKAPMTVMTMFYLIILTNAIMFAYLLILKNVTYGIIIYLYSLIFFNLYWRVALPGRVPDLDIPRLVFAFMWLIFLFEIGLGRRRLLPRTRVEIAMLVMLIALLFSMLFVGERHIRNLLNGFAIPYAMFVMGKNAFADRKYVDRLLYWFAVPLALYFPMNHIFEHYGVKRFVFPRYILDPVVAGKAVHWGERTLGAFLQPVATGLSMIVVFVLALHALSRLKGLLPRVYSWFLTFLTPFSIFLIYSRGAYSGFVMAMLTLLLFSKRLKLHAFIILLAAGLAVMANWENVKTDDRRAGGVADVGTAKGRLVLLEASARMFLDRPFFGVGFRKFQTYSPAYVRLVRSTFLGMKEGTGASRAGQHNHFLNTMTELGLFGLVPEVLLFLLVFQMVFKARKTHDDTIDHDFAVGAFAIFLAYLTVGTFMEPRFYEFMNTIPFMVAGIAVGSYQRKTLGRNNWQV
jgi:hypothetical protein